MPLDPVRSPVDGDVREALQVALDHQALAAVEHVTWPVGVSWATAGGEPSYVQWSHDLAGDAVPGGWLGLLEAGVDVALLAEVTPALVALGFASDPEVYGATRVLTWQVDDDERRLAGGADLLDLLERVARALGAPERAAFEVYPDA